jgi:hypothetical protein
VIKNEAVGCDMSRSRQLKEAEKDAASNPGAPAARRPVSSRVVAPRPQALTQAQLDARARVVPPPKDAEEEGEREVPSNRKKRAAPMEQEVDEERDGEEDDEEDKDGGVGDDGKDDEGESGSEADSENDEEAESGGASRQSRLPVDAEAKERSKKARKKRKVLKDRKKWSLGNFLAKGKKCVLCPRVWPKWRPDNVVRHWKTTHPKDYAAVEAANDSGRDVRAVVETLCAAATTPTGAMDGFVMHKRRVVEQAPKIMKEVALLRWLIESKVSFNTLDQDSFRDVLQEWGVMLESKNTMLNLLTPLFEHIVEVTERALEVCAGIACTFDLWTSSAGRKYLAITYHGIDESWRLFHCVLDVVHFRGSTQSEVIAAVVRGCIEKHLSKDKLVTVVVSDGGGDAKHAREDLLEFDGHDCFNHDLNLCLGDAVKLATGAAMDFATMEHLIREIESDKNLRLFFENMQMIAGFEVAQKFVHRNDTRWTGLADSVAKFLKMRGMFFVDDDGGAAEATKHSILEDWPAELSQDVFQWAYWERLKVYNEMLVPLSVATRCAQSLSVPTGSRVPKLISDMKKSWTQLVAKHGGSEKEFGEALLRCLANRCDKYVSFPGNTLKAACLDPSQSRFLEEYGVSKEVIAKSWEGIVKEGFDEFLAIQKAMSGDEDEFDDAIVRAQVNALKTFLSKAKVPADSEDPLQFYRDNVSNCRTYAPIACRVATNLLAIPAGESHSERVFSWAGGFVTKLRNRLGDETLQELVVMHDFFRSKRMDWQDFKVSFGRALSAAAAKQ